MSKHFKCVSLEGVGKELDFTRHPDKAHQMEWIRAYLGYRSELNGGNQEDVSERDVEEFYVKCSKFQLVSLGRVFFFVRFFVIYPKFQD